MAVWFPDMIVKGKLYVEEIFLKSSESVEGGRKVSDRISMNT